MTIWFAVTARSVEPNFQRSPITYIAAKIWETCRQPCWSRDLELDDTYPPFKVNGPALVQPKMLPRGIGDQVSTPAVSQLVRNDIHIFAVLGRHQFSSSQGPTSCPLYGTHLGDDTWSGEGEDGVLHATVRETWRQDQNIVLAPNVGVHNFLYLSQHEQQVFIRSDLWTSMVLMKFSVSASSSHLHSSNLSGLVATTLRGPMGASETSLANNQPPPYLCRREKSTYPLAIANR